MNQDEMNQAEEETLDNMNGELDETLDGLADLPKDAPYPAGAYMVKLTPRRGTKPGSYIISLEHQETLELAATVADDDMPQVGDKSTVFLATKKKDGTPNEFGQGQLKLVLSPLGELFDTKSIQGILDAAKGGVTCAVVVAVRKQSGYDDSQTIKSVTTA